MIEASAVIAKFTLPVVVLAWTAAVAVDDVAAAAVGFVFIALVVFAVVRSGRLRGKRAEGSP